MQKDNENLNITADDLSFLEKELSKSIKPYLLQELSRKIAFKKSASRLSLEVKKYDPNRQYEVGDLIYKEYDEPLIVSSKGAEQFSGSVVLKVINKIPYESFNCEMLEVDYPGGGIFRKHIDYMKKTKTQVLLPSNLGGKEEAPEIINKSDDPRQSELPVTEKDLKKLEKNLAAALTKNDKFFSWNHYWHLVSKRVELDNKKIKSLEKYFSETKQSAATTELIESLFGKKPSDESFDLYCLSLNYVLEKKYKKNILFVSPENWGRWLPKTLLDSIFKDLPLSTRRAKLPPLEEEVEFKPSPFKGFPLKVYLTWREVLSGGIKIPKKVNKELAQAREYRFTHAETDKEYTVYYYPSSGVFLGLQEFYEKNNVPQGASLTLEKKGENHFTFWLKKSKKKLSLHKISYNTKEDKFEAGEEELFTYCLPHKIIHLETETLQKLFSLYDQRDKRDLRELLILVFKNFGMEGEALALHYLRALHMVDVLKHTTQEDVEKVLLSAPEFSRAEKNIGIFFYHEPAAEEEALPEETAHAAPEEAAVSDAEEELKEDLPEIGTVGEVVSDVMLQTVEEPVAPIITEKQTRKEPPPPTPAPPPETLEVDVIGEETPPKAKKEKAPKKKRQKLQIETDRAPRKRKGERKIIEERIELEESELEALFAIKEDKKGKKPLEPEEKVERPAPKKAEEFKQAQPEQAISGIFGDMLKSALKKKKPDEEQEEKPKKKKKK
ncbi:MAG: hypothetical protein JXB23_04515 [Candidatus Aminicenantes bacterium]|nr:hypothetical protein [Candidatus Aminicenantes bacterium]